MRVVFMGTPEFAVPSLVALAEHHDVVGVVTRQDRAAGRGGALRPSAVKQAALERDLTVYQPETLRGWAPVLAGLAPDVVCVAAFGMLLPPDVLAVPPYGCINVHASLLPRYRGAAPVQRAVLDGAEATGVSIMRMEEGLDTGPYCLQRVVPTGTLSAEALEQELATVGAGALVEALAAIAEGSCEWVPQCEAEATYAAKITKDDVALRPEITVEDALRRVRAATRRAPARACLGDRELTVVAAHPVDADVPAGATCVTADGPVLGFADGALALDCVRPAGGRDMSGVEWARGARIGEGTCWRCTR